MIVSAATMFEKTVDWAKACMLGAQRDLDWAELNQISDSRIERL